MTTTLLALVYETNLDCRKFKARITMNCQMGIATNDGFVDFINDVRNIPISAEMLPLRLGQRLKITIEKVEE